jgi:hypothetical protein
VFFVQALAGLVEIPAIALAMYIINKIGKKWVFCSTFFCAAVACLCAAFVEGKPEILHIKITFLMIGEWATKQTQNKRYEGYSRIQISHKPMKIKANFLEKIQNQKKIWQRSIS